MPKLGFSVDRLKCKKRILNDSEKARGTPIKKIKPFWFSAKQFKILVQQKAFVIECVLVLRTKLPSAYFHRMRLTACAFLFISDKLIAL